MESMQPPETRTADQITARAREYRRLAAAAVVPEERDALLRLAAQLEALAAQQKAAEAE
jgi:hypothetical protein